MKKEQIQETIQKSFEQECRGYVLYAEAYNLMQAQIESFEEEIKALEDREEAIENVSKLKDLLNVTDFKRLNENSKDVNTDNLMKAVSDFLDASTIDFKEMEFLLQELYEENKKLKNLREDKKNVLSKIRSSIHYMISYMAENDMKLVVTEEISDVAYKALVEYYADENHFIHDRNIIDVENSDLPESFVKAYSEKGPEMDKALEWFEQKAKQIDF